MNTDMIFSILEQENVAISDLLPFIKADRYTFNNLDNSDREYFQNLYERLQYKADNLISSYQKMEIKRIINDGTLVMDYLYKLKIMEVLLK